MPSISSPRYCSFLVCIKQCIASKLCILRNRSDLSLASHGLLNWQAERNRTQTRSNISVISLQNYWRTVPPWKAQRKQIQGFFVFFFFLKSRRKAPSKRRAKQAPNKCNAMSPGVLDTQCNVCCKCHPIFTFNFSSCRCVGLHGKVDVLRVTPSSATCPATSSWRWHGAGAARSPAGHQQQAATSQGPAPGFGG